MAFEQGTLMLLKPSEFRINLVKSAVELCTQLWRLEIHLDLNHTTQYETEDMQLLN